MEGSHENRNVDRTESRKNITSKSQRKSHSGSSRNSVMMKYVRPCFTEFLNLLLFVFIGVCSAGGEGAFIPLVHGLAIMVLVFISGGISGGHINPAVTVGVFLAGALSPLLALLYIISQLLGAIVGAGLARVVLAKLVYENINGGAHGLGSDVKVGSALLAELIATAVLVLTVQLTAVDSKTKSAVAPIPIGFAVAIGIYAIGPISGGSLNPARSFGPAVIGGYWSDHYVYWVGPIFGALLASALYRLILASPDRLLFFKGSNVQQSQSQSQSQSDVELGMN